MVFRMHHDHHGGSVMPAVQGSCTPRGLLCVLKAGQGGVL